MNPGTDRITVPTNGQRPHPAPEPVAPAPAVSERPVPPTVPTFTPTQLVVGFGILAAVVALIAGSLRRRGRARRSGPFGRR